MPKILIVEDDEGTREIYAHVFKKEGFEVIEAVDGTDGLDKAIKNIPDVVFSGIMMPGMNGFELLQRIRARAPGLPVVMITTRGSSEDRLRGLSLGASAYLVKAQFEPARLLETIRRFTGPSR